MIMSAYTSIIIYRTLASFVDVSLDADAKSMIIRRSAATRVKEWMVNANTGGYRCIKLRKECQWKRASSFPQTPNI